MQTKHDKELERNGKDVKKKGVDIAKRALSRPGWPWALLARNGKQWKAMERKGWTGMDRNGQDRERKSQKWTGEEIGRTYKQRNRI